MATVTTKKSSAPRKLPDIKWGHNNHALIWALLTEIEKPKNRPLFFGRVNANDNTTGDSKANVCKRLAEAIFPEECKIDAVGMGKRVKAKIEALFKEYKKHSARLRLTGEGVMGHGDGENDPDPSRVPDDSTTGTRLDFYIHANGPDENTPERAKNIWDEITATFPFFPHLHQSLGTRPNVGPIVVATPLGPNGGQTVWLQPPTGNNTVNESNIDPVLLQEDRDCSAADHAQVTDVTPVVPHAPTRGPKGSSALRTAYEKASRTQLVPQKRSIAETMLEMAQGNMRIMQNKAEQELGLAKRNMLLEELKLGVWTPDEYKRKVRRLDQRTERRSDPLPLSPTKKVNNRASSPDWDSNLPSSDPPFEV
ncbi:hypothetical protein EST38_g13789 [Candolleomyces aberdarensis]|uniref:Uncharacterized protein n=1 Tax=Candolleomyces aberdarensis TaxID=2316362 RepID=A0A4Q2D1R0_9AGAR|nr:hypothetical protein EST38_g13789 [Candolleomyces aberdarensis]